MHEIISKQLSLHRWADYYKLPKLSQPSLSLPTIDQIVSARMSKITNDGLTRSGTGCVIAVCPCGNSGRQRVKITETRYTLQLHVIQQTNALRRSTQTVSTGRLFLGIAEPGTCHSQCYHLKPLDAHCCYMDIAIMHPVPDRVKPSFVILGLSVRVPGCQKIQMTA